MSQELQSKKYEIKIIKEVKYLPKIFLLRHLLNETINVKMTNNDFIDCLKEKGKLSSCLKLRNCKLETKEKGDEIIDYQ